MSKKKSEKDEVEIKAPPQPPPDLTPEEVGHVLRICRKNFLFYAKKFLKVLTLKSEIKTFELNGPQRILHRIVQYIEARRLVRIVALKARRMGFSTYFSGRFYHKTTWNKNRFTIQITHEPEATDTLFKMVKRFYNFTPDWIRPETLYNNTKLLEFNNKNGTGLGGAFRVATAEKEDFGSGQLVHLAHFSEVAKWSQATVDSLLTSVEQCIPRLKGTEIVFESTAKGVGGEFYDRFWSARFRIFVKGLDQGIVKKAEKEKRFLTTQEMEEGAIIEEVVNEDAPEENIYTAVFLPWFVFEEHQIEPPSNFKPTENTDDRRRCEVTMKKRFGLTNAQVYWWRYTIVNQCKNRLETMWQEFPSLPEEAFVATGNPVFDNLKLMALKETAPKPAARYECMLSTRQFMAKLDGRLRVWEEPKPGRAYIVAADVAESLASGDFSSADVVDHITGDQVAQWHGHIPPKQFAYVLDAIGRRYNNALLAPERNNHGYTVVQELYEETKYPNLYVEIIPEPPNKTRKRHGWVTSSKTRPVIIDNLVEEITDDTHGIKCRETFAEMMCFKVQDDGKMEADAGQNDDRVISIAIAKRLRNQAPLPIRRPPVKQGRVSGTRRKPPTEGWT